ncbi:MAG: hypothetical protein J6N32_11710 [Clostridia bacterium]|nr:hypothetical protein [Clostridia bacterium]
MKKRTLSLLLALLMLASAAGSMTACSEGTDNAETTASDTAATPTAGEEAAAEVAEEELTPAQQRMMIPDNLPDQTFGGRSYIIAVEELKSYEIVSEELNGEATNDAVYDRNLRIEDRFDVKIEAAITTNPYDNVKNVVTSGTYAYDIVGFWNFKAFVPITAGVLYNWKEMPYVDLDQPWHNKLANDPATINGKLYAINSDLSISTLQYTYGMFFNYNIWERYGVTGQDLYDMVFDGSWTLEKMHSLTTGIWEDTNGDGIHDRNDIHGYSVYLGLNTTDVWLAAFDLDVATINDDGSFEITFFNEKTVSALEKAIALSYDEVGSYRNTVEWRDVPRAFAEGKIAMSQLYFGETTESLGEMEDKYGILPLPKFDEAQTGYYTNAWDQFSVFGVPLTIADADKDMTGIIFEALCAESYKTVFPAYYDQALKSRYSAEPATAEIVDLIMAGRKLEFTFQFGEQLSSLPYMFRQMLGSNSTDVASTYKTRQKALNKVMEKMINTYFEE